MLGESIVSVSSTTASGSWSILPTLAAVGGFGIAACLWWLYFNFLETAVVIRGIKSVHAFNYGHLPILMELVLVAVGTEQTIIETATHSVLSVGTRWTLLGSVALYMTAIYLIAIAACRRRSVNGLQVVKPWLDNSSCFLATNYRNNFKSRS